MYCRIRLYQAGRPRIVLEMSSTKSCESPQEERPGGETRGVVGWEEGSGEDHERCLGKSGKLKDGERPQEEEEEVPGGTVSCPRSCGWRGS